VSLEDKVFFVEETPRSPKENLAINQHCINLVGNGKYSVIGRAYYHTKGVILGHNESLSDVNLENCEALGYEVVRRPTGGSAIVVDPKRVLCYSIFFLPRKFGLQGDVTDSYKRMAIPLATKLGKGVSVRGAYYLRADVGVDQVPIAGHALKIHSSALGRVVQFDGVVNRTVLDAETISKLLKLRELHTSGGNNYMVVDGMIYDEKGKITEATKLVLVRSEREELERSVGLREIGITDKRFLQALHQVMEDNFGEVRTKALKFGKRAIQKTSAEIERRIGDGKRGLLGHCFVDLLEPEPILVYG